MLPFNMGVGGSSGVDTGDIGHSLRFRAANNTYMIRTPGGTGSRRLLTFSFWVKGAATSDQRIWVADDIGSTEFALMFKASGQFEIRDYAGTYLIQGITTQLSRDPTGHLHVVVSLDTNQTTFTNAVKMWVNGSQITAWATSTYSGAHDMQINDTRKQALGMYVASGAPQNIDKFDGYLSRIAFVDGQALTPSSFGYLNTTINEWVSKSQSAVKAVVDAGGTNSFMLDFDDGTSLTTLGYDKSSKGNNWTLNNFSLTAGPTYDHMLDVPGNSYATLNNIYPSAANITNGNLSSGTTAARGTMNSTTFDSQWFVTAGASAVTAGVIDDSGTTNTISVTANKVFAFKMTSAGALSYKNVTDAGSWTSIATGLTGNRWPYSVTQAASWNFGQQPLPEALDTGYKALCQANMPTPAILNPELHHNVVLDTGANIKAATEALYPSNFLEWIKDRANSNNHQLLDTVRGSSAVLQSNTTAVETTYAAPSGNSVGGAWKAGGAAVTNNAGSISSQVSANVLAGFSIVTWAASGSGADQTVGHGLPVAPSLAITRPRNTAGYNWHVAHPALNLAGGYNVYLQLSSQQQTTPAGGWLGMPTATTISLKKGTTNNTNVNIGDMVAYCFAEIPGYSKIGSYTGNGSADGPYVECGFKPKFVMVKRIDSTGSWQMFDSLRAGYNVDNDQLVANTSAAEATTDLLDLTATGFKLRSTSAEVNASGGTYIFIAFADVAAKYSLGR